MYCRDDFLFSRKCGDDPMEGVNYSFNVMWGKRNMLNGEILKHREEAVRINEMSGLYFRNCQEVIFNIFSKNCMYKLFKFF